MLLVAAGLAAGGYGVAGLLHDPAGPRPVRYVLFAVAGLLGHDLVLAPLALLVGALVGRVVPAVVRGPVRAGLLATGVVALVAFPFVLGRGYRTTNPSALPLDYGHGLIVTIGGIWLGAAGVTVARLIAHRRAR